MEVQSTLEKEIIELVRLSTTKSIRDTCFSFSWVRVGTGILISIK